MVKRATLFKILVDYYIDDFEKNMKELLKDPMIYEKIDNGIKKNVSLKMVYMPYASERKKMDQFFIF
jgi:hypothetical protein